MKKLLSILLVSILFLTSCVKEELPSIKSTESEAQSTLTNPTLVESTNSNSSSARLSQSTNSVYVFLEPHSKFTMVSRYLRDSVVQSPLSRHKFLGFFVGPGVAIQHNVQFYFDMPHWVDGRLPNIYTAEIPQTSGGVDEFGNAKLAHNFTTTKIPKNTVQGIGWVNILIPVSAMANDTKRQRNVFVYEKLGNNLVTNGTRTGTNYTTNNVMYQFTINYQGNRIPKGLYRLYTTYPNTGFRLNFNSTRDVYIRGNGN